MGKLQNELQIAFFVCRFFQMVFARFASGSANRKNLENRL